MFPYLYTILFFFLSITTAGQSITLEKNLIHLRTTPHMEWSDFTTTPQPNLTINFKVPVNSFFHTLQLTQQDVRRDWSVTLNNHPLGLLHQDDNTLTVYFDIPDGALRQNNILIIQQKDTATDDIRVGAIYLIRQYVEDHLNETTVNVTITDRATGIPIPSKITIVNIDRSLQETGAASDSLLAVRPGIVYTGDGQASIGLPAGKFTLYATRGFEFGVDSAVVDLEVGDRIEKKLSITRERKGKPFAPLLSLLLCVKLLRETFISSPVMRRDQYPD